jgi:hypothetical protein
MRDRAASSARPALATAGAVALSVGLLEIAQQVIGVFSPRRSIQIALIVAVGLAALTAERLRAAGASRRDRVALAAGIGCAVALCATGAIWVSAGFSVPAKASVGEQVDGVRAAARRDGFTVGYSRLALHQGAASHVFVLAKRVAQKDAARRPSDEVRLYDVAGGELELRLAFRPDVTFPESPGRPAPASFHRWAVSDVDGDGQKEILASYDTNQAGSEFQRLPILISREAEGSRYVLTPLLPVRSLGGAASAGLPTYGFGPAGGRRAAHVWVSELALDRGRLFLPGHTTLTTSVVTVEGDPHHLSLTVQPAAPGGGRGAGIPRSVRFWELDTSGGRPRVRPLCPRTAGATAVRVPARELESRAFLGRTLADAMRAAGVGLGEFSQGRCLEAGS